MSSMSSHVRRADSYRYNRTLDQFTVSESHRFRVCDFQPFQVGLESTGCSTYMVDKLDRGQGEPRTTHSRHRKRLKT